MTGAISLYTSAGTGSEDADLVIGAWEDRSAYVVFGSSTISDGTLADVTLYGDGSSDSSFPTGFAPGDVTGDGVPDLGVAYVVSGVGM